MLKLLHSCHMTLNRQQMALNFSKAKYISTDIFFITSVTEHGLPAGFERRTNGSQNVQQ